MYIVVFNVGYGDPEVMTNLHGFIEEFATPESANEAAREWVDNLQYINFCVYKKID